MKPNPENPAVSVIVPIYNAERYLDACLQSLAAQDFRDFEVLMVNDGSTDSSREICLRYARQDSRFRLLEQENRGVSAARNRGLAEARGAYLQFADSDDAAQPEFISRMVQTARETGAELVICDFLQERETGEIMRHFRMPAGQYSRNAFLKKMLRCPGAHYLGVLWNKLYRTERIRQLGLSFPEGLSLGEDFIFNTCCYAAMESICCIEDRLYRYRWQNAGSLCVRAKPEEARMAERLAMYRAYREMFDRLGLYRKWELWVQYYIVKAYFDELSCLGEDCQVYKAELYRRFIRDNGIGQLRFVLFWTLKQAKQLKRKVR